MTDRAEHYIALAKEAAAEGERRLRARRRHPASRPERWSEPTFDDLQHELDAHPFTPAERHRLEQRARPTDECATDDA